MAPLLRRELDHNYDFFQRRLASLIDKHEGQYVLLRSARIIDFYASPGDAYRAGIAQFPDRTFSVQKVSCEPIEMGLLSVVVG